MHGYMFDTVVFNHILDQQIDLNVLRDKNCFATHVQFDELQATPIEERRENLISIFRQVDPEICATESFVLGVSRLGNAKLRDGLQYKAMLECLNQKNKQKKNNIQDVLIAETALLHKYVLVTDDCNLKQVFFEFGGDGLTWNQFLHPGMEGH